MGIWLGTLRVFAINARCATTRLTFLRVLVSAEGMIQKILVGLKGSAKNRKHLICG